MNSNKIEKGKGFKELILKINKIKKTHTKEVISKRIKEFKSFKNKSNVEFFKELCFCLMTANFNAERSIMIQEKINNGFLTLNQEQLAKTLKELGHRFPNMRAKYIVEARAYKENIKDTLYSLKDDLERRNWLVKHIKGLGLKEASHFLRNTGFLNVAIIDFHIVDLLAEYKIIEKPKSLTKTKYLQIEEKLKTLSEKLNLSLGELDLYLWFLETGKVLK
ncbi:MAG: N-glycosylase/DNA lyase [Candidatus Woesearchaeota archaeon]|nr:N-glycosylase/DNA lyase [Candidatus Woesearchaeota archaeon]